MQKVLICNTSKPGMKSEIEGWSYHDGDSVQEAASRHPNKNVCKSENVWVITSKPHPSQSPETPIHALAMGWKLLVPPTKENATNSEGEFVYEEWEWWFVKE